jgi:hypothetical protein
MIPSLILDLPAALARPDDVTPELIATRVAEGRTCVRCLKTATNAYVVHTDDGGRWIDLCSADSDAFIRWAQREIVVIELPTPANPNPEPPASPLVALVDFLSTR